MASELSIDTTVLNGSVSSFADLAGRVHGIFNELSLEMADTGECWGNDTPGRQFAAQYVQPAQQTAEGMSSLRDAFDGTGQGIDVMVRGFTATEGHNVRAATGLHG